ncbi:MAG TPA: alpha-2-macroglobulin, partial [Chitinophagaceae bacterium]
MHRIKPSFTAIIILLFLAVPVFAQQKSSNYNALWKIADTLIFSKGLPKSALAQVNTIYALAKKEKQEAQAIKALVYRVSLQEMVEEDADTKSLRLLENEINTSSEPSKSILYSILAFKYRVYLEQSRWKNNRTNTKNIPKNDFLTWTNDDFYTKIDGLYKLSLQNKALLQHTSLDAYNVLLSRGNTRYLRPTMYDLLAHAALDFYSAEKTNVTKPANAFEMKDENLLAPAATFARLRITSSDTASLLYKALLIYQDLLAFHLNDPQPEALIDADIARTGFVNAWGGMPQKDQLYEKALTAIFDQYPNSPAATEAAYKIASLHVSYNIWDDYNGNDKADTSDLTFAAALCKKVIKQPEESPGKADCYNLLKMIEKKSLHLTTERVNIPGQPFRTLVGYRNFSNLYLRVIAIHAGFEYKLRDDHPAAYRKKLTQLAPVRSWKQSLPGANDYHRHSTEIKIDPLPTGEYILMAASNPGFATDSGLLSMQYFYVS